MNSSNGHFEPVQNALRSTAQFFYSSRTLTPKEIFFLSIARIKRLCTYTWAHKSFYPYSSDFSTVGVKRLMSLSVSEQKTLM